MPEELSSNSYRRDDLDGHRTLLEHTPVPMLSAILQKAAYRRVLLFLA